MCRRWLEGAVRLPWEGGPGQPISACTAEAMGAAAPSIGSVAPYGRQAMDVRGGTNLRELLPEESFVPFQARRLADPSLVWESPEFRNQEPWLKEFAYAIPSDRDSSALYAAESKTFWAERYGGYGLLGHGGGVRVGLNGNYQVKGIGTNPLCDSGVALGEWGFWHSHGSLSTSDAIQEAAWGEVFSRALPFGGLRVAAVVGTGGRCWCKSASGEVRTEQRALAVREAALRPAHFLRAVTFRAAPGLLIAPDAARVAAAIRRLPGVLPSDRGKPGGRGKMSEPERVAEGLRELLRRSAEQCAAARSKRLMHGALAGSNVALDGRWLDYGTASALPQYANTHNHGLPSSIQTFWEDHLPFLLT